MTDRLLWQLEGDLRQAFENFCGGQVSGPWEGLIETVAGAVRAGRLDLATAARLQLLLERTQGGTSPDTCGTCDCPCPGQTHRD
jgi:hypothetical protein